MLTEKSQKERLKKYNLNIKTKFKAEDKVLERNTDDSKNDNVEEGIILEKDYYYKGQLLKKENIFDSRILYSYIFNSTENITCKNCGMIGKVTEFIEGCPYCGTNYNIDFSDKELGSKHYYDLVVKDRSYIKKTFIVDLIFSFIISLTYILTTSRTFYFFDFLKVIGLTFLISFLLFYFFYYLDAIAILPSVRRKKEVLNEKQREFWSRMKLNGIDKNKFYNNLNYDLRKYYYSNKFPNVIDYDIIDYNAFSEEKDEEILYVKVNLDIRIVSFQNNKISSKLETNTYKFKRVSLDKKLTGNINTIKCQNCGASIDVTKNKCDYCGKEFNYYQEWYLIEEK